MKLDSNEQQMVWDFLTEFQKKGKDLYQDLDLADAKNDLEKDSVIELELYEAPRDLFYDNKTLLEWIRSSVQENDEIARFFNLSQIKQVFMDNESDGDGDGYRIIFASEDDGMFIYLSGEMGQYCDENYDATAYITFDFKSSKENTQTQILETVSNTVRRFASNLQSKVDGATQSLPAAVKERAQQIIMEEFLQTKCLQPALAEKSRQELMSHVDSLEQPVKAKRRKV